MTLLKNRMISGVFWLVASRALGQAITWVSTIVVVRLLSPQDYGVMGMAFVFTGFLVLFNEIGLGAAIVQKADLTREQISDLTWVIFLANVGLFVFVLLSAPAVARYFNEPALTSLIRVLGAGFLVNGIGAASGYRLQREMEFGKKARALLISNVTGAMSTLALASTGWGVWSLAWGYLAQQVTTNVLYCVYAPPGISQALSLRRVREFVNFGFHLTFSKILWYTSANADFLIVGRVLGSLQLGYYSLAFQFSSLPIEKLVTIVTEVALPSFSSVQNDVARLRSHYLRLVGVIAFVTFPMFIGMFLVAGNVVSVFLTAKWLPVVLPLKLLCIVACLRAIEPLNAPLVVARGRPQILLWNSLLQALVMPISFYAGAQYGLGGVAAAWLITRPILFTVVTMHSLRVIELRFTSYLRVLVHPVAGTLAMVAAVMTVEALLPAAAGPGIALGITCGVGCATYFAYGALFNVKAIEDVLSVVRRRQVGAWRQPSGQTSALRGDSEGEGRVVFSAQ